MIEHFSKWQKLVPLLACKNEGVAYAFMDMVLSKLGTFIKIFIDKGTKLCGEFQKLCEKTLINHYMNS
jgi:hypothetical protein